jgi:HAD superfamily hydrolase (TIGR01509 family)
MAATRIHGSAAVFDFDGTVVDSFAHRNAVHKKISKFLLEHMGNRNYENNLEKMTGIITRIDVEMHQNRIYDRNLWWTRVLKRYAGKDLEMPESTITEASALYWDFIKKNTKLFPGVKSMLSTLRRDGVKLGLISDSDGLKGMKMERVEASGLAKLFDKIVVAGEDTPQVKPDPEAFILMISKLDVNSRNCVSIGDNPATDVDGALRAGMKAIIIKNNLVAQSGSSKRYYLVDRNRLTRFIIETLQKADVPGPI